MSSKVVTITLPDPIYRSLEEEGRPLGESVPELIKGGLMIAYKTEGGWTLNLDPVPLGEDPDQAKLPLVEPSAPVPSE